MWYRFINNGVEAVLPFVATGLLLLVTIYSIRKEPRRFRNCILVALSACNLWECFIVAMELSCGIDMAGIAVIPIMLLLVKAAGVFILDGIVVIRKDKLTLAHLLPLLVGCSILIALGIYVLLIIEIIRLNISSVFWCKMIEAVLNLFISLVLYFPILMISFYCYSFLYAILTRQYIKKQSIDFILVLGCALSGIEASPILASRLDRAIEYYHKGGDSARFVVSGGQGRDEIVSEACAMKRYLCQNGIPEDRILLEDRSTTTRENMKFSGELMRAFNKDYHAVFVTNNFHVLRSAIMAQNTGVCAQGIGCKTNRFYYPAALLREGIAIVVSYKKVYIVYVVFCIIWQGISALLL